MKRFQILALALTCFAGFAVAQKVVCNYDRGIDFSSFHTFKWVPIEGNSEVSQITSDNIVSLVNTELSGKGLVPASGDQPADLYVGFQASVDQQKQVNWFNSGGYWMGGMGSATTTTINVGTLVVDFYDPTRKRLLWRGSATNTLNPSSNPNKNYEKLQKAVAKLLKDFPPVPDK